MKKIIITIILSIFVLNTYADLMIHKDVALNDSDKISVILFIIFILGPIFLLLRKIRRK